MPTDREDMRSALKQFPEQVNKGFELAENISVAQKPELIIIAGMGGSALPGAILQTYLHDFRIPIILSRDYTLPEFVNSKTLVFAVSYSGNTEETISAYRNALRKGCKVITISSGGKLGNPAKRQSTPHIHIPAGLQPRCAYGYLFFSMLRVLQNSKMIKEQGAYIHGTADALTKPALEARGRELADQLQGKIPLIYTSEAMRAIGYKWKINFNENSKVHAFCNAIPELNHNEMVGYTKLNGNYHAIFIRDSDDSERIRKRMALTKKIALEAGVPASELVFEGSSRLARIFSAIYAGDWASYYLALKYRQDPTPVKLVENFKKKLS